MFNLHSEQIARDAHCSESGKKHYNIIGIGEKAFDKIESVVVGFYIEEKQQDESCNCYNQGLENFEPAGRTENMTRNSEYIFEECRHKSLGTILFKRER